MSTKPYIASYLAEHGLADEHIRTIEADPNLMGISEMLVHMHQTNRDMFDEVSAFLLRLHHDEAFRVRVNTALERDGSCLADLTMRAWLLGGAS